MNTSSPETFFTALGTAMGLSAMQPDENQSCTLSMGEKAVLTIALRPAKPANEADAATADPMLVAFAYLGPLPANEREATLTRLLEANFVWADTGSGATIALQPGTEAVNLMQQWRITPDLQADSAAAWIADFAEVANRWIGALEQADSATPAAPDNSMQSFQPGMVMA